VSCPFDESRALPIVGLLTDILPVSIPGDRMRRVLPRTDIPSGTLG
jgi:hypothetical protein